MKNLLVLLSVICSSVYGQQASVYVQPNYDKGRIYMSVDRGVNWTRADLGLPLDAVINAWTTMDRVVIVGTEKHGVFKSSDRMNSWHSSNVGLPRSVRILSVVRAKNLLFVGTYQHGLFYSDDQGISWQPASNGLTNSSIRVLHYFGGIIFAGTNQGLYVSRDAGFSWKLLLNGLQINSLSSEMGDMFVATNRGALRTSDLGMSWSWIYAEGAIFSLTSDSQEVYMLDFLGKVYVASRKNYVWLSADIYLPFFYTFRITPGGTQFFTSDWRRVFNGINNTREAYWVNGIPDNVPIKDLLDTPFGLLASVGNGDGC